MHMLTLQAHTYLHQRPGRRPAEEVFLEQKAEAAAGCVSLVGRVDMPGVTNDHAVHVSKPKDM